MSCEITLNRYRIYNENCFKGFRNLNKGSWNK